MSYKHILLIDDDVDDQEIFLTALAEVTHSVTFTALSSAVDALSQLINRHVVPDLIFLDLNMPVMTGQQFLGEIKKQDELMHIPVIVLSTTSHQPTIEHTKALGAIDFITKPDKFNDLINVLKSIMH